MEALSKKGTPAPAVNRNRGWHGAVSAPVHGYRVRFTPFGPVSVLADTGPAFYGRLSPRSSRARSTSNTKTT